MFKPYEIWWKYSSHEIIIFTKFYEDWTKDVDFLLKVNFWMWVLFLSRLYLPWSSGFLTQDLDGNFFGMFLPYPSFQNNNKEYNFLWVYSCLSICYVYLFMATSNFLPCGFEIHNHPENTKYSQVFFLSSNFWYDQHKSKLYYSGLKLPF